VAAYSPLLMSLAILLETMCVGIYVCVSASEHHIGE